VDLRFVYDFATNAWRCDFDTEDAERLVEGAKDRVQNALYQTQNAIQTHNRNLLNTLQQCTPVD
jgi:hypothetical protein